MKLMRWFAAFIIAVAMLWAGCSSNDSDTVEFTAKEQQAVDAVMGQLGALLNTLASLTNLTVVSAELQADGAEQGRQNNPCPTATTDRQGNEVSVTFDYGEACSSSATGETVYSGRLSLTYNVVTRTGMVSFDNFMVDGRQVSGAISLTITDFTTSGLALQTTLDVTLQGIGRVVGSLGLELERNGEMRVPTGNLTLSEGVTTYNVLLANLVIDPADNGNAVPEAGVASFPMQVQTGPISQAVTVAVTFTERSPQDGTVQISINGKSVGDYRIPGIA